jgi:hypothetical protein
MEEAMSAYNVVRFRVKPGQEQKFVDMHKHLPAIPGMMEGALIKTGDRNYCLVGKWDNFDQIVASRTKMVGILDGFRGMLEDLGGGLGVTDPVSGATVVEIPTSKH